MASLSASELMLILGTQEFSGRGELLTWLSANDKATISRPELDEDQLWTAADSRRNWEIRSSSTTRAGIEKGGIEDGVVALRELEEASPKARVRIISAESEDVVWTLLLTKERPICAFWVRRRR